LKSSTREGFAALGKTENPSYEGSGSAMKPGSEMHLVPVDVRAGSSEMMSIQGVQMLVASSANERKGGWGEGKEGGQKGKPGEGIGTKGMRQ
jgi:hypothetical protein